MSVKTFSIGQVAGNLPGPSPVPMPIGLPVSTVRSMSISADDRPSPRFGYWECSPGRWERQVRQAEFCHFLDGLAVFTPADGGAPVTFRGGDCAYFPAESRGVWDIGETSRKVFILVGEQPA